MLIQNYMPFSQNKKILILLTVVTIIFAYIYSKSKSHSYSDQIQIEMYYENWIQILNVHASPNYRLRFRDLSFNDVLGSPPYYINLEEIKAKMFVHNFHENRRIVLLYEDGQSVFFDDYYSSFRADITDVYKINIQNLGSQIELVYKVNDIIIKYTFDIENRNFSSVKRDSPERQN